LLGYKGLKENPIYLDKIVFIDVGYILPVSGDQRYSNITELENIGHTVTIQLWRAIAIRQTNQLFFTP